MPGVGPEPQRPRTKWSALADHLATPEAIAISFACGALLAAHVLDIGHDEAVTTYLGARIASEAPLATLFFQKFHPMLSFFYAPVTGMGWPAFVTLHVLVAASAVWSLGRLAAREGGSGALTALIVATSPAFFTSAITGQSNSDGVAFLGAALCLSGSSRAAGRIVAGLLLAATTWVRYEFAPLALLWWIHALFRKRDYALTATAAAAVLAYLVAGVLYHEQALWFLRFAPGREELIGPLVEEIYARMGASPHYVSEILASLWLVTPVLLFEVAFLRAPAGLARWLKAGSWVMYGAMIIPPFVDLALGYEHQPRYLLVLLPFSAVGAGLMVRRAPPLTRSSLVFAVAWLLAGVAVAIYIRAEKAVSFAVAPFAFPLLLRFARSPSARAAVVAVLIVAVAGSLAANPAPLEWLREPLVPARTRLAAAWLHAHPEAHEGRRIYTNSVRLALQAERAGGPLPISFVPRYDMIHEIHVLSNHDNGQYRALLGPLERNWNGGATWPCRLPERMRAGDLWVQIPNRRTFVAIDREAVERETELLARFDGAEIRRVRRDRPDILAKTLPAYVAPETLAAPCLAR